MKRTFLFTTLLIIGYITYAQNTAFVLDEQGNPIDKVNVFFADQNILVFTNNEGSFLIGDNIAENTYLHIYKQGYRAKLFKYSSNQNNNIVLEKLHVYLDEIGISETFSELGNINLTNIEKKLLNSLDANSMVEGITELSGVDMISSGLGIQKIVVRGLSGMRVVTYLNGMQINNQQWANDHGIGFTDLGLSEVELIKGASALKYGSEAIGGLLYFKDDPFVYTNKLKGFINSRFNNSSYLTSNKFGLKWNKKNVFFNVYGQYATSADYRLPNNTYLNNSRFQQNAIKFSIGYKYNNWQNIFRYQLHQEATGIPGHVHTSDLKGVDLSSITSPSLDWGNISTEFQPYRPTQFIDNQLFIYESKYMFNNLKFDFYLGHFMNNLTEYERWGKPAFDLDLTNTLLAPNLRYITNNLTMNFGSQILLQQNTNNTSYRLVPDASSFNLGPYVLIEYEKDNFGANTGIRYDTKIIDVEDNIKGITYYETFSHASFSTGLYYKYIDNIFRITYSGAYRSPHFSELFSDGVHHGTNRYEIGDETLTIEYANQIDFKYQWSNQHLGIVINPFIQDITDFISIQPIDSVKNSYKVYNYIQYDKVNINGFEMNLHYHPHKLHNLHLEQSYSFLQAVNEDSKYGLALVPANSIKTKVRYSFDNLKGVAAEKVITRADVIKIDYFSLYHIYKFKQDNYAEYEEATNAYNVINFQVGFKFNSQLYCRLTLNNLLNETYTPHTSRLRGISEGVPNPGRFIDINVKYEF